MTVRAFGQLALAAAILPLALSAPAAAADTPRQALAQLAAHQVHGWADAHLAYPELEARIAAGVRVRVPCGVVSILGLRLTERLGVSARLVGAFANQRGDMLDVPDDTLESHAMLEVWEQDRWVVYDLDGNVRGVDQDNKGVGVIDFAQGTRHYDSLATDELYDPAESPYPAYERWLFANHEAWYDRVLGTVAVKPLGWTVYFFTDPGTQGSAWPHRRVRVARSQPLAAAGRCAPTTRYGPHPANAAEARHHGSARGHRPARPATRYSGSRRPGLPPQGPGHP